MKVFGRNGRRDSIMEKTEMVKVEKGLLNIDSFCSYLDIGKTKARELLHDYNNGFTVRIGNRLYAHKGKLDEWLLKQIP